MNRFLLLGCFLSILIAGSRAVTALEDVHQVPLVVTPQFTFRDATIDDMDGIATVHYEAFRPAEFHKYMYQFEDEVEPGYIWTCFRDAMIRNFYSKSRRYIFKVLTVPESANTFSPSHTTDEAAEKIVSMSVWRYDDDNANQTKAHAETKASESGKCLMAGFPSMCATNADEGRHVDMMNEASKPFNCSAQLSTNMTRARHLNDIIKTVDEEYFRKPFERRLQLGLLATHPDWDGHGFASQHLHWGKAELARLNRDLDDSEPQKQIPIVLFGTPVGYPLYVSEGFKGVKNMSVKRLDGKGILWWEAMVYQL